MFAVYGLDLACCGVEPAFVIRAVVSYVENAEEHLYMRISRGLLKELINFDGGRIGNERGHFRKNDELSALFSQRLYLRGVFLVHRESAGRVRRKNILAGMSFDKAHEN